MKKDVSMLIDDEYVGAPEREVKELVASTNLQLSDAETIYSQVHQLSADGSLDIRIFGSLVQDIVMRKKAKETKELTNRIAKDSSERKKAIAQLRKALKQRQKQQPTQTDEQKQQLADLVTKDEEELKRLETVDAQKTQDEASEQKQWDEDDQQNRFRSWEFLSLLRCTPTIGSQPVYAAKDLFTALAVLLYDTKPEEEKKKIPTEKRPEMEVQFDYRNPTTKLSFAFRNADDNADGYLSSAELTQLFSRMFQTGHFRTASLLRPQSRWNPLTMFRFTLLTPQDLTMIYLHELGRLPCECNSSAWKRICTHLSYVFSYGYCPPRGASPPDLERAISFKEFLQVSQSLSTSRHVELFYLTNPWHGMIKRKKLALAERSRRCQAHLSSSETTNSNSSKPQPAELQKLKLPLRNLKPAAT